MIRFTFALVCFLGISACSGCGDDAVGNDAGVELDAGSNDGGDQD